LAGFNQPTHGEITFNGNPLGFSEIGFLPNIPSLYAHLTIEENFIWLCRLRQVPHHEKALLKEWRQPNRLIFFSTHHVTEVASLCDEIVFLHQGQFHFEKQSIVSKVTCL